MLTAERIQQMVDKSMARFVGPEDEMDGLARVVRRKASEAQWRTGGKAKIRAEDDEKRVIRFIASNERVDRAGDIIRVAGWRHADFDENGVFLSQHKSWEDPIGRTEVWKELGSKPALMASVTFPTAEVSEEGDRVYRLYRGGFMRAVSVGFRPTKTLIVTDEEERADLGLGKYGVVFEEQELLELSAVSIPANPDALMQRSMAEMINAEAWADDDTQALEAFGWDVDGIKAAWMAVRAAKSFAPGADIGDVTTNTIKIPTLDGGEKVFALSEGPVSNLDVKIAPQASANQPPAIRTIGITQEGWDKLQSANGGTVQFPVRTILDSPCIDAAQIDLAPIGQEKSTTPDHAEQAVDGEPDPEPITRSDRAYITERLATVGIAMNEIVERLAESSQEAETRRGGDEPTETSATDRDLEDAAKTFARSLRERGTSGETQAEKAVSQESESSADPFERAAQEIGNTCDDHEGIDRKTAS